MKLNNFSFRLLPLVMTLLLCALISGCSTYSNKWKCPDANGLHCKMLSTVDEQINSGEIKEVYEIKCKGKNCKKGIVYPIKGKSIGKRYDVLEDEEIAILNAKLPTEAEEENDAKNK